jgi:hypothetical protein
MTGGGRRFFNVSVSQTINSHAGQDTIPIENNRGLMTAEELTSRRADDEPPAVVAERGWRYHHIGIPTTIRMPNERYLEKFGLYVSGFETSPYGIEWMRYEPWSPVAEIIKTVPHIAFEVDDLEAALAGKEILTPPNSPSDGVRVAMILHNGAPVELIQFSKCEEH